MKVVIGVITGTIMNQPNLIVAIEQFILFIKTQSRVHGVEVSFDCTNASSNEYSLHLLFVSYVLPKPFEYHEDDSIWISILLPGLNRDLQGVAITELRKYLQSVFLELIIMLFQNCFAQKTVHRLESFASRRTPCRHCVKFDETPLAVWAVLHIIAADHVAPDLLN